MWSAEQRRRVGVDKKNCQLLQTAVAIQKETRPLAKHARGKKARPYAKSQTKSSREAARGQPFLLSGEPGKPVQAIRAGKWRPEGQRANSGRFASKGWCPHIRPRDSARALRQ